MRTRSDARVAEQCVDARVLRIPVKFMTRRSDAGFMASLLRGACGRADVAYLHLCTGLHEDHAFRELLRFLASGVWAVNLGELCLSPSQRKQLLVALSDTDVTHMFYECTALDVGEKEAFLTTVRANRRKHTRWILREGDAEHNAVVLSCTNMWFDPVNHGVNKRNVSKLGFGSGNDAPMSQLRKCKARAEQRRPSKKSRAQRHPGSVDTPR